MTTDVRKMSTDELIAALARSSDREVSLEYQGMPTSEARAISATIRMELSERLGVKV